MQRGGQPLTTPLDALFEARSTFFCAAVLGIVPLVLLYWRPPVSEKGTPATESAVPQNPS